jgi:hypothetical protein
MKATLEFELPEDQDNYMAASHGIDYALVCWDLDQKLREWLKHGNTFQSANDAIEKMREELRDIMFEHNVNLNMIS